MKQTVATYLTHMMAWSVKNTQYLSLVIAAAFCLLCPGDYPPGN